MKIPRWVSSHIIPWPFWKSPQGKFALAAIVLAVAIFSGWLIYPRDSCATSGGTWIRDGVLGQAQYCLYSYPDAGKACRSSTECLGSCVVEDYRALATPGPSVGVCTGDNRAFGCFDYLEHPNVFSVCTD